MFCGLNAKKKKIVAQYLLLKFGRKNSECQVFIFAQYKSDLDENFLWQSKQKKKKKNIAGK